MLYDKDLDSTGRYLCTRWDWALEAVKYLEETCSPAFQVEKAQGVHGGRVVLKIFAHSVEDLTGVLQLLQSKEVYGVVHERTRTYCTLNLIIRRTDTGKEVALPVTIFDLSPGFENFSPNLIEFAASFPKEEALPIDSSIDIPF